AVGAAGHPHHLGLEPLDRPGLVQVERESGRLALDDVGQHDGVEDVVLGQPLRGGRPVEPGADDGDLLASTHAPTLTTDQAGPRAGCRAHPPCSARSTTLSSSMARVIGPTPPGTGARWPATS